METAADSSTGAGVECRSAALDRRMRVTWCSGRGRAVGWWSARAGQRPPWGVGGDCGRPRRPRGRWRGRQGGPGM